jgi:hypothetical protein
VVQSGRTVEVTGLPAATTWKQVLTFCSSMGDLAARPRFLRPGAAAATYREEEGQRLAVLWLDGLVVEGKRIGVKKAWVGLDGVGGEGLVVDLDRLEGPMAEESKTEAEMKVRNIKEAPENGVGVKASKEEDDDDIEIIEEVDNSYYDTLEDGVGDIEEDLNSNAGKAENALNEEKLVSIGFWSKVVEREVAKVPKKPKNKLREDSSVVKLKEADRGRQEVKRADLTRLEEEKSLDQEGADLAQVDRDEADRARLDQERADRARENERTTLARLDLMWRNQLECGGAGQVAEREVAQAPKKPKESVLMVTNLSRTLLAGHLSAVFGPEATVELAGPGRARVIFPSLGQAEAARARWDGSWLGGRTVGCRLAGDRMAAEEEKVDHNDNRPVGPTKLTVSNLPPSIQETHLRSEFSKFGQLEAVERVGDYAILTYGQAKAARQAVRAWDGKGLGGRLVRWLEPLWTFHNVLRRCELEDVESQPPYWEGGYPGSSRWGRGWGP